MVNKIINSCISYPKNVIDSPKTFKGSKMVPTAFKIAPGTFKIGPKIGAGAALDLALRRST
jgi:hypothetical protein